MSKSKSRRGRGTGISPIDVHVGARLRVRRALLGMTQTNLGDALGVSFQQMQKYDRGMNRIGSGRMFGLSRVLDVPVEYFFEEIPSEVSASSLATKRRGKTKELPSYAPDPMAKRESMELVRAYYKIRDPQVRKRLCELTKALGTATSSSD